MLWHSATVPCIEVDLGVDAEAADDAGDRVPRHLDQAVGVSSMLLGVGIVDVITPPLCRVAGQLESEARTSPGASGAGRELRAGCSPFRFLVDCARGDAA